jgi:hypothetical protein
VKRAAIIAMLSIYALLSLGVQLHLHYCCGELSDFHFFASKDCKQTPSDHEDHCCKKGNCCSFIHIDLKVDDSHQPSETARFIPIEIAQSLDYSLSCMATLNGHTGFITESHSPPPISRRYVLYRSLVLYA